MMKHRVLHVNLTRMEPLRVVFLRCTFPEIHKDCHNRIRHTFQFLREWAVCMGLNPAELIQVGIPILKDGELTSYACCLEYPLPYIDEASAVNLGQLPGGLYAITRQEQEPGAVGPEFRDLIQECLEEKQLKQDKNRPIYEIHYPHDLEYCVPVVE